VDDQDDAIGRLIKSAEERFGEHPTAFLLNGLGESEVTYNRTIIVTRRNIDEEFRINIITSHPEGLPQNDHPLVLLAFLHLWLDRGLMPLGQLVYSHEEVFDLLGWKSSDRSRSVVDEAVERYSDLNYEYVLESSDVRIMSGDRLVTGYRAWDETVEGSVKASRVYREVRFNRELLKELKGRALFGIDWRKVRALESLPRQPDRESRTAL
jgi:hypothetical protein